MTLGHHFELTFSALKRWFVAQCYDALIVALLWLAALCYLRIPLAAFWAILGGLLQFVPHFGPLLALLGPTVALLLARAAWAQYTGLLIPYAGIALVDGLFLQPYLMRRQNRVPMWASIVAPLVLGLLIPFWGVFLAPPLLAVIYAYLRRRRMRHEMARSGGAIVLPPESPARPRATPVTPVVDSIPESGSRREMPRSTPATSPATRRCRSAGRGGEPRNR